jgi:hypothetical protein
VIAVVKRAAVVVAVKQVAGPVVEAAVEVNLEASHTITIITDSTATTLAIIYLRPRKPGLFDISFRRAGAVSKRRTRLSSQRMTCRSGIQV